MVQDLFNAFFLFVGVHLFFSFWFKLQCFNYSFFVNLNSLKLMLAVYYSK